MTRDSPVIQIAGNHGVICPRIFNTLIITKFEIDLIDVIVTVH